FGGGFLADGGLHERGASEEEAGALGHEDVIAHDGKISAAGYAHAHDGGELRDAEGAHDRVIAEDAAEIVGVGENVFLERKKNAGGIHEINGGDAIVNGDVLRANDLFGGHGEEGAGFDGGVVGDEHEHASGNAAEAGDGASGRRSAPFLVHFVGGVETELEEVRARIDEGGDAFAGGEAGFFVLGFDGFGAAALEDLFFFVFVGGEELDETRGVLLEVGGLGVDGGF